MDSKDWVVVNEAGEFWTGSAWHADRSKAALYSEEELRELRGVRADRATAVRNYGQPDEDGGTLPEEALEPPLRYVIVGYADDQKQTFWDVLVASSREAAEERWRRLRGHYAVHVATYEMNELLEMVEGLDRETPEELEAEFRAMEEATAQAAGNENDSDIAVSLAAKPPFSTWSIVIDAPAATEPTALYAALKAAGFVEEIAPPSPVDGCECRTYGKPGSGAFGTWTPAEAREHLGQALAVLEEYGFDNLCRPRLEPGAPDGSDLMVADVARGGTSESSIGALLAIRVRHSTVGERHGIRTLVDRARPTAARNAEPER
jgi:hypothetical protein